MSTSASSSSSQACPSAALIFLHGLGDTPAGWSSLKHVLPSIKPSLKNVEYVFPPAPITSITINGGTQMPGWFDLFDWPIGISAKDDREGILRSVQQIRQQVAKLEEKGIPKNRIVVGGFSQGGAIAMLTAYMDPERFAGCVALSGWLTLKGELNVSDAAKETPLFWGHGSYDDKVLFVQQAHGIKILQDKGVSSILHESYPMGHSSDEDETIAMANFLDGILFGNGDK
jgi:lysophospholipase II